MRRMEGGETEYVRVCRALWDDYRDGRIDAAGYARALKTLSDPRVEADLGVRRSWTGGVGSIPLDGAGEPDDGASPPPVDADDPSRPPDAKDTARMLRTVRRLRGTAGNAG